MNDSMIWTVLKMVGGLGILLLALAFLARGFKNFQGRFRDPQSGNGITLLSTAWIAPQKYISLVEIGNEVYALGISEAQITLLAKMEDRELVNKIKTSGSGKPGAFSLFPPFTAGSKKPHPGWLRFFHGR